MQDSHVLPSQKRRFRGLSDSFNRLQVELEESQNAPQSDERVSGGIVGALRKHLPWNSSVSICGGESNGTGIKTDGNSNGG